MSVQQDAVGDGRLHPQCGHLAHSTKERHLTSYWCRLLANSTKHSLVLAYFVNYMKT